MLHVKSTNCSQYQDCINMYITKSTTAWCSVLRRKKNTYVCHYSTPTYYILLITF